MNFEYNFVLNFIKIYLCIIQKINIQTFLLHLYKYYFLTQKTLYNKKSKFIIYKFNYFL